MKKSKPKARSESGITLIALLVMIIIIVILAGITIRALTGNEGLLSVAGEAAENYEITAKKEALDQAIRSEMIAQATLRKNSNTPDK